MNESIEPLMMAEQLRTCYESKGFKIFWDQIDRETNRTRTWTLATPRHDTFKDGTGVTHSVSGYTERELSYRKGWLDCLELLPGIRDELLSLLKGGQLPGQGRTEVQDIKLRDQEDTES